MGIKNITESS